MWSDRNSHLKLVEMQNATVTLEDSLTVLQSLLYDPAIATLGISPTDLKTHRYSKPYTNAYSRFIHNC